MIESFTSIAAITGPIDWEDLKIVMAIAIPVATLWWRVETRISTGAKEAIMKADLALSENAKLRLDLASNYADKNHIKEVEGRLLDRLDGLVEELHGMRQDFQAAILKMAGTSNPARRR
jgi:hypothetical protein